MADNTLLDAGTGGDTIVTREITHGGDTAKLPGTFVMGISGAEGSYTAAAIGGDATNGLQVDVTRVSGTVTVDGSGVTQPVSHAALTELAAAINASSQVDVNIAASNATVAVSNAGLTSLNGAISGTEVQVDIVSSALPTGAATAANQTTIIGHLDGVEGLLTTIDADTGTLAGAVSGTEMQVDVVAALPAGNNNIGDVDVASIAAGTNNIGNVGLIPRTSGGLTIFRSIDLDESEEEVKASAGQLYFIHAINLTNAVLYLKFYNATAANTTVGTTTPVLTFPIPTQGDTNGAGFTVSIPQGFAFGTAISAAVTTGLADNDTGAPAANACVVNLGYS